MSAVSALLITRGERLKPVAPVTDRPEPLAPEAGAGTVQGMTITDAMEPVQLTPSAAAKVAELLAEEADETLALRMAVRPGGCSGFSYEMFFDSARDVSDRVDTSAGVPVVVDAASAQLLAGATLDYKHGLQAGFHITNPNAQRTCGCGQSFS